MSDLANPDLINNPDEEAHQAAEYEAEIIQARVDGYWQDKLAICQAVASDYDELKKRLDVAFDAEREVMRFINEYFTTMARDELNL